MPAVLRLPILPAAVAQAFPSDDGFVTNDGPAVNVVVHGALGRRLERLRRQRGLTLAHFADAIGVSKPTVWAWESGRYRPRSHRLAAIAEALGVDLEELTDAALARGSVDDASAANAATANVIEECRQRIAASLGTEAALVRIIVEV